ncbi:MAG TPA: hypothetical protein VLL08_18035 [Kineosporiaceae bacterium]|nr:hypothetical protein [Kineosporiaceae bacterium]
MSIRKIAAVLTTSVVSFAALAAITGTAGAALGSPSSALSANAVQGTAAIPAALPSASVDPGKPGKYKTVLGEYSLPDVKLPDYSAKVEMKAVVVAPKGATGSRPLALFLHGQHLSCYGDPELGEPIWPCPVGTKPYPNYRGYLRAQRLLASQGYITVSISANGINGQDLFGSDDGGAPARSSLIRLHLAHWAEWAAKSTGAPSIVRKAPRADLSKVLLMGHSQGGDGVNRAAIDSLTPPPSAADGYHGPVRWTIRGTVLLASTLPGHNPAADVPSVAVLPGCDGANYTLQGQYSVDGTRGLGTGTALHSAVFVIGANHNYFNTEWTPGLAEAPAWDDWGSTKDAICGTAKTSLRLTPVQQQKVGATYIAAAARLFIKDDDRVLPLLDGSGVRAPSLGKARVLSHAVGAARRTFILPARDLKVTGAGATTARLCKAVTQGTSACSAPSTSTSVPHFVPFKSEVTEEPDRYAVSLTWSKAGGTGAKLQPKKSVSLTGSKSVAIRIIVPKNSAAKKFDVVIADTAGRKATLGRVSVTGLPGTKSTVGSWAQEVRAPLKAARKAGLNLSKISRLQVIPRSSKGKAWVLDAWGWRAGTPAVRVAKVARVDVGPLAPVAEADADFTYQMPVTVSGQGSGKLRVYVVDPDTTKVSTQVVSIPAGAHQVGVPLKIPGDNIFGPSQEYLVLAEAMAGTVVGDFIDHLKVIQDDPAPTVTVTPVTDQVTEGGTLKWQLKLSEPAVNPISVALPFLPPAGAELSTTDLPADWEWWDRLEVSPMPTRPLSEIRLGDGRIGVGFAPGVTMIEFSLPTAPDSLAEGPEQVRLQVKSVDGIAPDGPDLIGTVNDPS